MTLTDMLTESVTRFGDAIALSDSRREVSYSELVRRTVDVAAALAAKGLQPGDRVALALPNVIEFAYLYYGITRAGGIVVPFNPMLRPHEIVTLLKDADPMLVVAWAGLTSVENAAETAGVELCSIDAATFAQAFPPAQDAAVDPARGAAVPQQDDDVAVLLYTSGTTGEPKGAMLTHDNLVTNARVDQGLVDMNDRDVLLGALPLFHSFGQTCCLNLPLLSGSHVVLLPQFNPREALAVVGSKHVTVFLAVPGMYAALLQMLTRAGQEFDLSSLRMTISSGAPLPVELLHQIEEHFGVVMLEGYGLSETSPTATLNVPGRRRPGTVGPALPGVELRILDPETGAEVGIGTVGEVAIRGHNVMRGYWRAPEATAAVLSEEGWLRTGDLGTLDEDGFLTIVDRKKDLVIVGGENVYPREVEEVLYEHPAVAECAVLGVPDLRRGEIVVAAVVLKEGQEASEAELRAHIKAQLAGFKVPRAIWFPQSLPKGGTNKIVKREIEIPEHIGGR
ncbi:long-chain-fatty-acid--CoA ligase [Gephyromycinifex aptenodytis]|uniref:long-chain-fatty-acid--CoA ligase n=1 Tax=Gephyromycinifex aptenodytis TaxID=2716227 RepID=UPI001447E732|nr:long-chain fatty acid--CoA ligase [Gephyromycinifex aptenodytis]